MKKHTKIYMDFHGYDKSDWIGCEACGATAVDCHHISPRGIGGDPTGHKNQIENLIALCRSCHIKAETDKQFNNQLKELNKHKHSN
jgi:5-methylcytosine-specific restriction endonuclease McrA